MFLLHRAKNDFNKYQQSRLLMYITKNCRNIKYCNCDTQLLNNFIALCYAHSQIPGLLSATRDIGDNELCCQKMNQF